eukprot:3304182-Rhodomonas_salina.2
MLVLEANSRFLHLGARQERLQASAASSRTVVRMAFCCPRFHPGHAAAKVAKVIILLLSLALEAMAAPALDDEELVALGALFHDHRVRLELSPVHRLPVYASQGPDRRAHRRR